MRCKPPFLEIKKLLGLFHRILVTSLLESLRHNVLLQTTTALARLAW
jgi:hypothetical protein